MEPPTPTHGSEENSSDSDDDVIIKKKRSKPTAVEDDSKVDESGDEPAPKRRRLKKASRIEDEDEGERASSSSTEKAPSPPRRMKASDYVDSDSDSDAGKGIDKKETSGSDSGSDSDSDSDSDSSNEKPRRRQRRGANKKALAKAKIKKTKEQRENMGSAYDEERNMERTKEDDDFIDNEDDDEDVMAEYANQKQEFHDDEQDDDFEDNRGEGGKNRRRKRNVDDIFDVDESEMNVVERLELKKKRSRIKKKKLTEEEKEDVAKRILYKLEEAADRDMEALKSKQPGTNKIKALKWALAALGRRENQETLLSFNLCGVLEKWITPLPDGSLPSLDVRCRMYTLLASLPINKEHLTNSSLGKVVMRLFRHPKETAKNKRALQLLIESWMRPVFQKTNNYKIISQNLQTASEDIEQVRKRKKQNKLKKSAKSAGETLAKAKETRVLQPQDKGFRWHPQMREPVVLDYKIRPTQRKIEERGRHWGKTEKQKSLEKRLTGMRRPQKKDKCRVRMTRMSIEGRKVK
eukprot:g2900.t1